MEWSTWKLFVSEYISGTVRNFRRSRKSQSKFSKDEIVKYFSRITPDQYSQSHTSFNRSLFIEKILPIVLEEIQNNWTILDLGAGFCDLELALIPKLSKTSDLNVIALDRQEHMLVIGQQRIKKSFEDIPSVNIDYVLADVEECVLESEIADLIICINVTPYLENLDILSLEANRLLKTRGKLLLVQPTNSPFWEDEFEGIKLNFFSDGYTEKSFKAVGFQLINKDKLIFNFIPYSKLLTDEYATLFLFKKD